MKYQEQLLQDLKKLDSMQPAEMFDEQDPFDFIDNLLDSFSEDQLCLLEQRIFSTIARKREQSDDGTIK